MHSDYYSTVGNTPCVVKNRHLKSEYCYLAPLYKKAVSADKAFLQAIINDHNFKSRIQLGGTVRWAGQCKAAVPALRTLEKDLECEVRGYRRTSQQTTRKYPKCSFSKDKLLPCIFCLTLQILKCLLLSCIDFTKD